MFCVDSFRGPVMPGKIYRYLADDHARLEALLQRRALARAGYDMEV